MTIHFRYFSKGMIAVKHALVIGGTGMLANVSIWLSKSAFMETKKETRI